MRVAIVGAHGKVGQRILNLLYQRGDDAVGLVRDAEQGEDVVRLGGDSALIDLERTDAGSLARTFDGADAIVFAAGAGAGSGPERKHTVDYGAAVLSMEAASLAHVHRFVQISAMGVDSPVEEDADPSWAAYVEAKRNADARLRDSGLDWTILRPGGLTTEAGTGGITLGATVERGSISRDDVAALVLAVLDEPRSIGRQWEVTGGTTAIADALVDAL